MDFKLFTDSIVSEAREAKRYRECLRLKETIVKAIKVGQKRAYFETGIDSLPEELLQELIDRGISARCSEASSGHDWCWTFSLDKLEELN